MIAAAELARVPVPVAPSGHVLPCLAVGYMTEDCHVVVGFDIVDCIFLLSDGSTRTHGEISFNSFLVHATVPKPTIAQGTYARCSAVGDCRVDSCNARGVLVRSATRSVVVLESTLQSLRGTALSCYHGVTLLMPGGVALVVKNVHTTGGTMACLDHVMHTLRDTNHAVLRGDACFTHGTTGDHTGPVCIVSVDGTVLYGTGRDNDNVVTTTHAAARGHFEVMRYVLQNPWALGVSLPDLLRRLGHDAALQDPRLLCGPYAIVDGVLELTGAVPQLDAETYSVPASVLVKAVRSGEIVARAHGLYTMTNTAGGHTPIVCPVDLKEVTLRLEQLVDSCLVVGNHKVRDILPECPDVLLAERFGKDSDTATGSFASRVVMAV